MKFSLSDNVQDGTKMVSYNGAVREVLKMSELGGAIFRCLSASCSLPLSPSVVQIHRYPAADQSKCSWQTATPLL